VVKINAFEGARRIAKLFALIGVATYAIYLTSQAFGDPRITVAYEIRLPAVPPVRVDGACRGQYEEVTVYGVSIPKNRTVNVDLCFLKREFSEGRYLVPYKVDDTTKKVWGNERNSTEVSEYMARTKASFAVPKQDHEWIEKLYEARRWLTFKEEVSNSTVALGGWLLFLWLFSWATGWIVRGFLGIPRGQDRRPADDKSP